ncbi:MAG: lysine decarboxylase LdcC, partial [Enterobacteriaceae bacterium]
HFDSAWVPYTHFHQIYEGLGAMSSAPVADKVIYETQSTHKLLAAFSQASMIHIQGEHNENSFNEVYMMHTTTSPNYNIVASVETAAAMMRGNYGYRMISRSIERALHFRHEIERLRSECDGWFFQVWQPGSIDQVACWPLNSGDDWHGFGALDEGHMYLDPIKVTIITPGMSAQGELQAWGIPAALVAKYLDEQGIIVEKSGPYNLLFLFSIGIDKTKALSLLRGLTEFKRVYDLNLRVKSALPSLYALDPDFYENMRIQDLAQGIHQLICRYQLPQLMHRAFEILPTMVLTPYQMFHQTLRGHIECCELKELLGKVSANMILPYPPGVPLIMPGEKVSEQSRAILDFLLMLCNIGEHYPGFETDIHGIECTDDGRYLVRIWVPEETGN